MRHEKHKSLNLSTICSQTRCARLTQRWADPRLPFYPHWRHRGRNTRTIQTGTSPFAVFWAGTYTTVEFKSVICAYAMIGHYRKQKGRGWAKRQPEKNNPGDKGDGLASVGEKRKQFKWPQNFQVEKFQARTTGVPAVHLAQLAVLCTPKFLIFTWTAA